MPGYAHGLDAEGLDSGDHVGAEGRIPVEDQIPWCGVKGKGLAQLPNDPQRRGIETDVTHKVEHAAHDR